MIIRRVLLPLLLLSWVIISHAVKPDPIQMIVQDSMPESNVGMLFVDKSGQVLYERQSQHLYCPASVTKLFTAAAALYKLGPEYRFKTSMYQKNKDVMFKFVGDPALTRSDLETLIQVLKTHGVSTIAGDIIIDASRYSPPDYPPGLTYEDLGWYYAAPVNAIIINGNAVKFTFDTQGSFNTKPQINVIDPSDDTLLSLHNRVLIKPAKQVKHHCDLHVASNMDNTLTLYGCVQQRKKPYTQMLSVPNTPLLAERIIRAALAKDGISFAGEVRMGTVPRGATLLASHESAPLSDLLKKMLRDSDNVYANSFAKTLGYEVTGTGSFKQGSYAIKHILGKKTNLDVKRIKLSDGAGNRFNLISPQHVVGLLKALYDTPALFEVFSKALPQSGLSGSLADRMQDETLKGKVLAKTGSMHDITALAGYLFQNGDVPVIFCMMSNQLDTSIWTARRVEEEVLKTFSEAYLNS